MLVTTHLSIPSPTNKRTLPLFADKHDRSSTAAPATDRPETTLKLAS